MKNQDPLLRAYCHELLPFFAKIKYAIAADLTILLNSKEHDQITKHELDQQRKQGFDIANRAFALPVAGFDSLECLNQFLEAYAEKPFSEQNNMSNISSAKDEDIHDHMVEKNQIKAIYNAIQNYLDGVTDKIIIRFGEANIAIETKNDLLEYLSAIGMPKEKIESLKELSPMDVKEKNIEGLYQGIDSFVPMCTSFLQELLYPLMHKWSAMKSVDEIKKEGSLALSAINKRITTYKELLLEQIDQQADPRTISELKQKVASTQKEYLRIEHKYYQEEYPASSLADTLMVWAKILEASIIRSIEDGTSFEFGGKVCATADDIADLTDYFLFDFNLVDKFSVEEVERIHKYLRSYNK